MPPFLFFVTYQLAESRVVAYRPTGDCSDDCTMVRKPAFHSHQLVGAPVDDVGHKEQG